MKSNIIYFVLLHKRFVGGAIIFILVFSAFLFVYFGFQIRHIEIYPSTVAVQIDPHQVPLNLLFFPSNTLKTFLLQTYPSIHDVEFSRQYPGTLRIKLNFREPVASVIMNDRILSLDKDGVVFESLEKDLPILEIPLQNLDPGKKAEGRGLHASLSFLVNIRRFENIKKIVLSNEYALEVHLRDCIVLLRVDADGATEADTLHT
ncbi:MAG: hypothetical protein N3A54_05150, partial [Patescibacteria group bacterium]|nr:hypothetical protein [Patescibacteria group bacterium]